MPGAVCLCPQGLRLLQAPFNLTLLSVFKFGPGFHLNEITHRSVQVVSAMAARACIMMVTKATEYAIIIMYGGV